MNNSDAIYELLKGKKVYRIGYDQYFYIDENGVINNQSGPIGAFINIFDAPHDDWSVFEGQKLKQKFYRRKWIICEGRYKDRLEAFVTKADFDHFYIGKETQKSDEWEEIEV